MAWDSEKAKINHYNPAYIEKGTLESAESNDYIKSASKALMIKANELMNLLSAEKIDLTMKRRDGTEYKSKAVVSVKQAVNYDRETGKERYLTRKDGSPIMSLTISLKTSSDDTLIFYAKEDISNGAVIQNINLKSWINRKPALYKIEDLKNDNIQCSPVTKSAINCIWVKNYIQEKGTRTEIEQLTLDLNKLFNEISEKVKSANPDKLGNFRTVNNTYAQYLHDTYGEKCVLRSHTDNIIVELGITGSGKKYALATNFDQPENTPEGVRYKSIYLNVQDDLDNLSDSAMKKAVAIYKGFEA